MKVLHTTIFVKDIDVSAKFYEEVLGLTIVRDMREGDHKIVFLNDQTQDFCVELAQGASGMSFVGKGVSIGVACDDLDAERERLAALGIEAGPVISPNPHVKFFFVSDPNGFQVQFVEEAK